jgi:hypothetical protein
MNPKTHYEDKYYWAVIYLPNGHTYYNGPHKSRTTAYRVSIKETKKHHWAERYGFIYNTRAL